jgi:hypothetical protein
MRILRSHPSEQELSNFATEGGDAVRPSTRLHLADCEPCRAEVSAIRELIAAARSTPPKDKLRPDALKRVLEARRRGERGLLPVGSEPIAPSRRLWMRFALGAAAVLLVVGGISRFARINSLDAADVSGTLQFGPTHPAPGAVVTVDYRPASTLAAAKALVLRGRFRTRWGGPYDFGTHQTGVAILTRIPSGRFVGSFTMPAGVVFGAFAVEDSLATIVDSNGGRTWELLTYESDRPLLDALRQEVNDLMGRDAERALRVLRTQTELYPADPSGWATRVSFEKFMLGEAYFDSTLASQRERFLALDRALQHEANVAPEVMAGMGDYGVQISTPEHPEIGAAARGWRDRLSQRTDSSATQAVEMISRDNSLSIQDSTQGMAASRRIEQWWQRGDSLQWMTPRLGFQVARFSLDSSAVLRWVDRYATRLPVDAVGIWTLAAKDARLLPTAIDRVRKIVTVLRYRDDSARPLNATASVGDRLRDDRRRLAFASLGDLLLRAGDTTVAIVSLDSALADGWNVGLSTRLARLYWSTHDTVRAARANAFTLADPSTTRAQVDSIDRRFASLLGSDAWRKQRESANREFKRRVLSTSSLTRPSLSATIVDDAGRDRTLKSLIGDHVTVLVFWSRFCGASRLQLPGYNAFRANLVERGIEFIPVTHEKPSPELRTYLANAKLDVPVFYDIRGQATKSLNNYATPTYYVFDKRGARRFVGYSPTDALAQAVALGSGALP